jgi:hypothetical protein
VVLTPFTSATRAGRQQRPCPRDASGVSFGTRRPSEMRARIGRRCMSLRKWIC